MNSRGTIGFAGTASSSRRRRRRTARTAPRSGREGSTARRLQPRRFLFSQSVSISSTASARMPAMHGRCVPLGGCALRPSGDVPGGRPPTLSPMSAAPRPEAIDSRLVFRIYAAVALPLGIVTYLWPLLPPPHLPAPPAVVRMRITAAVVTALGSCAAAFAAIDDPLGRRRGLMGFGHAHLMLGVMLGIQAWAQYSPVVAPSVLVASVAAITGSRVDVPRNYRAGRRPLPALAMRQVRSRGAAEARVRRPQQAHASAACARNTRCRSATPRDRRNARGWRATCTTRSSSSCS